MDAGSFQTILQLLQTASVVIAMIVAVGTIRGRGDDKTSALTKMQVDIEYIKKTVDCIPQQSTQITALDSSCKSAHKRLDDHLRYDHGQRKDEEL